MYDSSVFSWWKNNELYPNLKRTQKDNDDDDDDDDHDDDHDDMQTNGISLIFSLLFFS